MEKKLINGEWSVTVTENIGCGLLINNEPVGWLSQYREYMDRACSAVNNTYGKGIDPEYLANLIECMEHLVEIIKNDDLMFDGFPPLVNARAALKSIKLEDK